MDTIRQCVQSGFCCKQAPCQYGEATSDTNRACRFLEVQEVLLECKATVYKCGKYEEIKNKPGSNVSSAFGAGCCSPMFNTDRQVILSIRRGQGNDSGSVGSR